MHKYEQNKSQFNGIMIKNSDMNYELKYEITKILKHLIEKVK